MDIIRIADCTGETREQTLKWQLIRYGVVKDCNEFGSYRTNDPRSVFYHFQHFAAQNYIPDAAYRVQTKTNCGVCFHDITMQYRFVLNHPFIDTSEYVKEDGTHVLIQYPKMIYSGCDCIHLSDDLLALVRYCFDTLNMGKVSFHDGMIDATDILLNVHRWKWDKIKGCIALPLEWFYFLPAIRRKLVIGQRTGPFGAHVKRDFNSPSVKHRMSLACKYYLKHEDEDDKLVNGLILDSKSSLIRAYLLFHGYDRFKHYASIDDERQPCDRSRFVILTQQQAYNLYREIRWIAR